MLINLSKNLAFACILTFTWWTDCESCKFSVGVESLYKSDPPCWPWHCDEADPYVRVYSMDLKDGDGLPVFLGQTTFFTDKSSATWPDIFECDSRSQYSAVMVEVWDSDPFFNDCFGSIITLPLMLENDIKKCFDLPSNKGRICLFPMGDCSGTLA